MIYMAQQTAHHAQQAIAIGNQGRKEISTLRSMCTMLQQQYDILHAQHKDTLAELERLKSQTAHRNTWSELQEMQRIEALEAKISLFEKAEKEPLLYEGEVEQEYRPEDYGVEGDLSWALVFDDDNDDDDSSTAILNSKILKRERDWDDEQQSKDSVRQCRRRKAK